MNDIETNPDTNPVIQKKFIHSSLEDTKYNPTDNTSKIKNEIMFLTTSVIFLSEAITPFPLFKLMLPNLDDFREGFLDLFLVIINKG